MTASVSPSSPAPRARLRAQTTVRAVGLALLAACSVAPVTVAHASGFEVWQECVATGTVSTNHSAADFADAIANAPGDGAEYSPCLDDIRAAQAAQGASSGQSKAKRQSTGSGKPAGASTAPSGPAGLDPAALSEQLAAAGIDPTAPPEVAAEMPAPVYVTGPDAQPAEPAPTAAAIDARWVVPLPMIGGAAIAVLALGLLVRQLRREPTV